MTINEAQEKIRELTTLLNNYEHAYNNLALEYNKIKNDKQYIEIGKALVTIFNYLKGKENV